MVIHCTELPDLEKARTFAEHIIYPSGTGNSGHFYIDTHGQVFQWIDLERVAHHVRGFNTTSVGIELSHPGRYPHWYRSDQQRIEQPYPKEQITALQILLNNLQSQIPRLKYITGHEQLDTDKVPSEDKPDVMIQRKMDPGPTFPWDNVLQNTNLTFLKNAKDYE